MLRLATILFIIIGATLAGIGILAVVSVPSLSKEAMRLIPYAALAGLSACRFRSWSPAS